MKPKSDQTGRLVLFMTIGLVILLAIVAQFSPTPSIALIGSTAVLGTITAIAVGIERGLEVFWTVIDTTKGSSWPLGTLGSEIDGLADSLDKSLKPFYEQAGQALTNAANAEKWTQDQLDAAKAELASIQSRIDDLKKLAPNDSRVQALTVLISKSIDTYQTKYPELQVAAGIANDTIASLNDFVATFKDHPGRRLISIYMGAFVGLIIAGVIGLDLLAAAADTTTGALTASTTQTKGTSILPHLSIAFTGLVMGLGANPVHEVVRVVQEIKRSRKAENVSTS